MTEVNSILELLENLDDKYLQADDANKVKLLKSVLSNCTIEGENVHWTYKKPFCYITKTANSKKILPRLCQFRSKMARFIRKNY